MKFCFTLLSVFFLLFSAYAQENPNLDSLEITLQNLSWRELDSIGIAFKKKYQFDKSEIYLKKALQVAQNQNGKDSLYAISYYNLAELYRIQGLYQKAEPLYIDAKEITQKIFGKEHLEYIKCCHSLAILYAMQGLYQKAEVLFIEIQEKTLDKEGVSYAIFCNNFALLYKKQGLYQKAEPLLLEAKEIKERVLGKENPSYATACHNLAELYRVEGLYQKAEPLYLEAKEIKERILGKKHPDYATSCNNLAIVYMQQGLYQKAEPLYLEAKEIVENVLGKEHPSYAMDCNNLAILYQNQGLYQKSELLYKETTSSKKKQIKTLFPTLSETEKQDYFSSIYSFFNNFTILASQYYPQNKKISQDLFNQHLFTKGIIFSSTQKMKEQIISSQDTILINQYEDWKKQKTKYISFIQTPIIERDSTFNVVQLASQINELEREISQKSESFKENTTQKEYTWQDAKRTLSKNEAIIEIIRLVKFDIQDKPKDTVYVVMIVTDKTQESPELFVLENGKDMEKGDFYFYQNTTQFQLENNESYDNYWKQIQNKLDSLSKKNNTKGYSKIYFSPDGIYHKINLNTFKNPKTEKYLIEEQNIQLITSSRDLIERKEKGISTVDLSKNYKSYKAYLLGYPSYNLTRNDTSKVNEKDRNLNGLQRIIGEQKSIPVLEGTKVETNQINNLFNQKSISTTLFQNKEATEENIKSLKSPTILHFATHGFFINQIPESKVTTLQEAEDRNLLKNPFLRSGLLLAGCQNPQTGQEDGVLSAEEAMNLNLEGTELVVLSACETGLGDIQNGEGVYGLQRAFRQAGAKTIIMSLWKVSDEATQLLMTTFYESLLSGKSKRDAFKMAQLKLKSTYNEPYYWGAFVMVGE